MGMSRETDKYLRERERERAKEGFPKSSTILNFILRYCSCILRMFFFSLNPIPTFNDPQKSYLSELLKLGIVCGRVTLLWQFKPDHLFPT